MRTLNLGCGSDLWGTDRIDKYKTESTTLTLDFDTEVLPFEDNTFDEIRIIGVIEHLKNLDLIVRESYRVLKPKGILWVVTDNAGFFGYHLVKKYEHSFIVERCYKNGFYGHDKESDNHLHLFSESHLYNLFSIFKDVVIKPSYMNPRKIKSLMLRLLPKNIGATQWSLTATK